MLPRHSVAHPSQCGRSNIVFARKMLDALTVPNALPNPCDIRFSQFRIAIGRPRPAFRGRRVRIPLGAPLLVHIKNVVPHRSAPKMARVDASGIIASVHDDDALPFWQLRSIDKFVHVAVGYHVPFGATANTYHAVTCPIFRSRPVPTAIRRTGSEVLTKPDHQWYAHGILVCDSANAVKEG